MNYKKIILSLIALLWVVGIIAQQICWASNGDYNVACFVWAIVELSILQFIFKAM